MQRLSYLSKLGDKLAIVYSRSKEAPDLSDGSRGGPLLDDFCLLLIGHYLLSRDDVSQIGDLFAEQFTF